MFVVSFAFQTLFGASVVLVVYFVVFFCVLLAPKASEASKGAFYLFPGVVSGYCDA